MMLAVIPPREKVSSLIILMIPIILSKDERIAGAPPHKEKIFVGSSSVCSRLRTNF